MRSTFAVYWRRRLGFTLIELLIVVAIIGILAAIAIPNFLEAQTRAKVSRAKAELRTLCMAMELYYSDNGDYPWPEPRFESYPQQYHDRKLYSLLSTPIAYISTLPKDPFGIKGSRNVLHEGYGPFGVDTGGAEIGRWHVNYFSDLGSSIQHGEYQGHVRYGFDSWGPIGIQPYLLFSAGRVGYELYDPTNGTISVGTIERWGPGVMPHETWDW